MLKHNIKFNVDACGTMILVYIPFENVKPLSVINPKTRDNSLYQGEAEVKTEYPANVLMRRNWSLLTWASDLYFITFIKISISKVTIMAVLKLCACNLWSRLLETLFYLIDVTTEVKNIIPLPKIVKSASRHTNRLH